MKNEFLRHTLSTIDYRFQKSVKKADDNFGDFTLGKGSRTPRQIINHMYDVLHGTRLFVNQEKAETKEPELLSLESEIKRFNDELKTLDFVFSEKELEVNFVKRLLQGPLSDILTHIGQISMLSRMNDHPIKHEDFSAAHITTGKTE